jgi:hypothetical protein
MDEEYAKIWSVKYVSHWRAFCDCEHIQVKHLQFY